MNRLSIGFDLHQDSRRPFDFVALLDHDFDLRALLHDAILDEIGAQRAAGAPCGRILRDTDGGREHLEWTLEKGSTVTVVKAVMPFAPNRPHKSTMAEGSGLMERTAVSVRTGTINTGNPVDTTSSGHFVSVIVCLGIPSAAATLYKSCVSSMRSEKLRLWLGHHHAHDLTVPHQQIDRKQPDIALLHHARHRFWIAIMPSCANTCMVPTTGCPAKGSLGSG